MLTKVAIAGSLDESIFVLGSVIDLWYASLVLLYSFSSTYMMRFSKEAVYDTL